jgi:hypothetical protein
MAPERRPRCRRGGTSTDGGAAVEGARCWGGGGDIAGDKEKGKKRTIMCNQWQVGNFLPPKQLKAGVRVLSCLYYTKTTFSCGFG